MKTLIIVIMAAAAAPAAAGISPLPYVGCINVSGTLYACVKGFQTVRNDHVGE